MLQDATSLMTALCLNIKPVDEFLAAKTSHLLNSMITKQNLQFGTDSLWKVISWHIECLRKCTDIVLPDIFHSLQCILQYNPQASHKVGSKITIFINLNINSTTEWQAQEEIVK